jgi:hypothetical protein
LLRDIDQGCSGGQGVERVTEARVGPSSMAPSAAPLSRSQCTHHFHIHSKRDINSFSSIRAIDTMNTIILSLFAFLSVVAGHGGNDQTPMVKEVDWASRHMNGKHFHKLDQLNRIANIRVKRSTISKALTQLHSSHSTISLQHALGPKKTSYECMAYTMRPPHT